MDKFADGEPRGAPQCRRVAANGDWADHRGYWHDRDGAPDEDDEATEEDEEEEIEEENA